MDESLSGRVPESHLDEVKKLVEDGEYDSGSEFVRFATRYTLSEKHDKNL